MGQYHFPANLDRLEYLHPHKFGDGLKMLEFGASGEGTMLGLAVLLACSHNRGGGDLFAEGPKAEQILGRWSGDRIAIVGDYSEPDDIPDRNAQAIYDAMQDPASAWRDISEDVIAVLNTDTYINIARPLGG